MTTALAADFEVAEEMIKYFIRKVRQPQGLRELPRSSSACRQARPPWNAVRHQRQLLERGRLPRGPDRRASMAAAIGLACSIHEPTGFDGRRHRRRAPPRWPCCRSPASSTRRSVRVGGDKMDEVIISYMRRNHNLLIGETTAERIKKEIGTARAPATTARALSIEVKGPRPDAGRAARSRASPRSRRRTRSRSRSARSSMR